LSCLALLGNGYVLAMVLGIFIYVGTEVCISTHVPVYLNAKFGIVLKTWGILGTAFFFIWILVGRFLGSVVLTWISATKFLLATVLVTIVGVVGLLLTGNQAVAITCIMLAGIGCANIFPLIFSITVNRMPERTNEISGLMVTAIVGGAFLPPLMGYIADQISTSRGPQVAASLAFLVPLVCGLYLLFAALLNLKPHSAEAKRN
jgi:MFS transporter, FHS family, L-fucose permease